jgi:hypothetical protein
MLYLVQQNIVHPVRHAIFKNMFMQGHIIGKTGILYVFKIDTLNLPRGDTVFQQPQTEKLKEGGFTATPDTGNHLDEFLVLIAIEFVHIFRPL